MGIFLTLYIVTSSFFLVCFTLVAKFELPTRWNISADLKSFLFFFFLCFVPFFNAIAFLSYFSKPLENYLFGVFYPEFRSIEHFSLLCTHVISNLPNPQTPLDLVGFEWRNKMQELENFLFEHSSRENIRLTLKEFDPSFRSLLSLQTEINRSKTFSASDFNPNFKIVLDAFYSEIISANDDF